MEREPEPFVLPPEAKSNRYKTEMCKNYMNTGQCPFGNRCQFAHGGQDLRRARRHPKYKTLKCKSFWTYGTCPYGNRCQFLHLEPPAPDGPRRSPGGVSAPSGQSSITDNEDGSIESDCEPFILQGPPVTQETAPPVLKGVMEAAGLDLDLDTSVDGMFNLSIGDKDDPVRANGADPRPTVIISDLVLASMDTATGAMPGWEPLAGPSAPTTAIPSSYSRHSSWNDGSAAKFYPHQVGDVAFQMDAYGRPLHVAFEQSLALNRGASPLVHPSHSPPPGMHAVFNQPPPGGPFAMLPRMGPPMPPYRFGLPIGLPMDPMARPIEMWAAHPMMGQHQFQAAMMAAPMPGSMLHGGTPGSMLHGATSGSMLAAMQGTVPMVAHAMLPSHFVVPPERPLEPMVSNGHVKVVPLFEGLIHPKDLALKAFSGTGDITLDASPRSEQAKSSASITPNSPSAQPLFPDKRSL